MKTLRRSNGAYYLKTTLAGGADPNGFVEPDGKWTGSLSQDLAIFESRVDAKGLVSAFKGLDPLLGRPLDPRHHRVEVAAIDCVFAAPKSVSVLHALGREGVSAVVRDAHERAVEGVLGYLERNAAFVRRQGNLVEATGLLAAAFVHRTSRAPDPHLHTHLLVTNLGRDHAGRFSAIDSRPFYAHVAAAGSLYRSGLRREISDRVGVVWERRAEGFSDILGISPAALRGFSQRSDDIEAELEHAHSSSRRAREVAADHTRPDKQLDVSYEVLVERWRQRALDLGVTGSSLDRVAARTRQDDRGSRQKDAELLRLVEESVGSFDRPFSRRELVRATSGRVVDGAPVETIESAVDAHLRDAPLVRSEARVAFFSRSGSGRFPSGVAETRFMTEEIAGLVRARDETLAALASTERRLDPDSARACVFGSLVLPSTTAAYEFVHMVAKAAHEDGRRVVSLAASRAGAAHLEAVTGVSPEPWKNAWTLPRGAFVVVDALAHAPLREAVDLLELARSRRIHAVFLDRLADGAELGPRAEPMGRSFPLDRFEAHGVRVVVAPDLSELASEVRRLSVLARAQGRDPVVVSARPDSIEDLIGTSIEPRKLRRALEGRTSATVLVVGSARSLDRALTDVPDDRRIHLVLAPIGGDVSRAAALGIAEPGAIRSSLGRYPLGSRDRARWMNRAEALERSVIVERPRTRDRASFDRGSRRRDLGLER
ncbi:MAG: MobF family relaxase [Acidimicrobiales bacterium]